MALECFVDDEFKRANCHKNILSLKKTNVKITLTEEYFKEYQKCASDPIYFIENYVKVVSIDKGLHTIKLREYQKRIILDCINENKLIIKMPRQCGKTTTFACFFLWLAIFNPDESIAICANKRNLAVDILSRIKMSYEYLPWFLQQGIITWNKTSIYLENGTKIVADATKGSSIRGGTFGYVLLDEFAHVPDGIADEFFNAVYPVISSSKRSKLFIISTPKGLNKFYKIWHKAEQGKNNYKPIAIHWSEIPGRDEEWKKRTIADTSEQQFAQEFECQFLGSANTLIDSAILANMVEKESIEQKSVVYTQDKVEIYEDVQEGHTYVLTCDVAEGVGLDFSVCQVIDISEIPYKQVAVFASNRIEEALLPDVIYSIGKYYNDAYVLIENNFGREVADILEVELEYENLIYVNRHTTRGQIAGGGYGRNVQNGLKMSKTVKRIGCSTLKTLLENQKLILNDETTIDELKNFIQIGNSYQADSNGHDDHVMALVLFAWLTTQDYFKDLSDENVMQKIREERLKEREEEANAMPFFAPNSMDGSFTDDEGNIWTPVSNKNNIIW